MKKFNNVIKGTLILTTAGILSKILGFFYRIYLSRCIGAAGMGLFQIVMPAAGIVFAICSSGIQTAISKFCCDKKNDFLWLISGLLLSIPTSLLLLKFQLTCHFITIKLHGSPRTEQCQRRTIIEHKTYFFFINFLKHKSKPPPSCSQWK